MAKSAADLAARIHATVFTADVRLGVSLSNADDEFARQMKRAYGPDRQEIIDKARLEDDKRRADAMAVFEATIAAAIIEAAKELHDK